MRITIYGLFDPRYNRCQKVLKKLEGRKITVQYPDDGEKLNVAAGELQWSSELQAWGIVTQSGLQVTFYSGDVESVARCRGRSLYAGGVVVTKAWVVQLKGGA